MILKNETEKASQTEAFKQLRLSELNAHIVSMLVFQDSVPDKDPMSSLKKQYFLVLNTEMSMLVVTLQLFNDEGGILSLNDALHDFKSRMLPVEIMSEQFQLLPKKTYFSACKEMDEELTKIVLNILRKAVLYFFTENSIGRLKKTIFSIDPDTHAHKTETYDMYSRFLFNHTDFTTALQALIYVMPENEDQYEKFCGIVSSCPHEWVAAAYGIHPSYELVKDEQAVGIREFTYSNRL